MMDVFKQQEATEMKKQELKELLTPEFLSTLHTAVECCNWDVDMMGILDGMLREKEQEKIKAEKRKEVLAKLTDEELELLGVK